MGGGTYLKKLLKVSKIVNERLILKKVKVSIIVNERPVLEKGELAQIFVNERLVLEKGERAHGGELWQFHAEGPHP